MLRGIQFTVFSLVFAGCALIGYNPDAITLKDVEASLTELRALINGVLPSGQRGVSPNGREILSNYFVIDRKNRELKPAGEALERFYAKFLILGDRRPYQIEVSVTRERRIMRGSSYSYQGVDQDRRLAKELANRLHEELTKRPEDRNIIDDFRVF